jgi:glycosyltransferase involved in cell wall biosynthesis
MTDTAVIMSVYFKDKLRYLEESVQSILNQTFSDFHYYIAIDGPVPSDIEDYLNTLKDERIRLYRIGKNGGLAAALNHLLETVLKNPEYRYIARMDADDISMPERFEKQRNFLINNPEISVLGSWYEEIDENGEHLSYRKPPIEHEALKKRYYTRTPFAHSSVMFQRRLIEIAGYYPKDTVLMEDNVLWGRALKFNLKLSNLSCFIHKFRISSDFYKRRTGFKYAWCFVKKKIIIHRSLQSPLYAYFITVIGGLLRILPSFLFKLVYKFN